MNGTGASRCARHRHRRRGLTGMVVVAGLVLIAILVPLAWITGYRTDDRPTVTFIAALLPAEKARYIEVLEAFTGQTGIRVRLVTQQYEQIRTVVEAEAQAGAGRLDLVELDLFQLPLLREHMQPLDPLLEGVDDLARAVPPDAWAVGLMGEPAQLFYMPHRLNWQALIYDHTVMPGPPADWEALLVVAREHPGRIGLKCAKYEGLVCDIFPFLWQAGGDPLRPDSPEALRTMEFLRELSRSFNTAVRSYKEESIRQAQEFREIVLHLNWPFVVPTYRQKNLLPQVFGTAPLPRGPAGMATVLGGGYVGIPRTAPNPREAARLVQFLASAEAQRMLAGRLGWFPIRQEGWEALSEQDRELYAGYMAMQPHVRARPNVPYYPEVSRIWQDGFYAIIFDGADPQSTLRDMQQRIDALKEAAG